jgi:putative ABC transport system ATP-binding protein
MTNTYRLCGVEKVREAGGAQFQLRVPELGIARGEKVGLVGPSGCGKSTLLDMLAMVLRPTGVGCFEFCPEGGQPTDLAAIWNRRRLNRLSDLRKHHVGYVLQTGGLLPFLSVRDNIDLSRRLLNMPDDGSVETLAESLDIGGQLSKLPGMLSVGERQRVAIARALAHDPAVVIADEPTASLDPGVAQTLMSLFLRLADSRGFTVIIASHDKDFVRGLGLRVLAHNTSRSADGLHTESVFSG